MRRVCWQVIRSARESRGLSTRDLAAKAGIAQPRIVEWESGAVAVTEDALGKIAIGLGITIFDLFAEYAAKKSSTGA